MSDFTIRKYFTRKYLDIKLAQDILIAIENFRNPRSVSWDMTFW